MKPRHLLLLVLFFSRIISLHADVCTWTGMGDGVNWSDGNNWSCTHLPGAADDVIINSGTPTLDVPASIASMTMTGGTLTGSNTISLSGRVFVAHSATRLEHFGAGGEDVNGDCPIILGLDWGG